MSVSDKRALGLVGSRNTESARLPDAEGIKKYVSRSSSSFGRLLRGTFELSTHGEAERLSAMLGLNTVCPEKASMGFWELLSNAIEHGNLEISMDLKSELLLSDQFESEVAGRQEREPYRNRRVTADFSVEPEVILLRVTDQGPGFNFRQYLNNEVAYDRPNGRGLFLARNYSFDTLEFFGKGNIVEGKIFLK
jgi:anti-sigma regulatory factor (Ser/Thr protein kinase)